MPILLIMRNNILVLALLFCGGFFLAAQSYTEAAIYVTPVTGKGSKAEDNFLFYTRILNELTVQKANLANSSKDADYSLFGTLAPSSWGGQYVFHLGLWDNKTGGFTVEGELFYKAPDDTNQLFSALIKSLLYTIPAKPVPEDNVPKEPDPKPDPKEPDPKPDPGEPDPKPDPGKPDPKPEWRNDWLYLGAAIKWKPALYSVDSGAKNTAFPGIQGGISAELQFLDFLSFETGVEVGVDGVRATISGKETDFYNLMLEIPLLLKLVLKPGINSMIEPYLGAYFNVPLIKNFDSYPVSLIGGLQYGFKAGPGAIFFNAGFSADIDNFKVNNKSVHRYNVHIGLGYKYGFFPR